MEIGHLGINGRVALPVVVVVRKLDTGSATILLQCSVGRLVQVIPEKRFPATLEDALLKEALAIGRLGQLAALVAEGV